jgi:hypothetical protein
MTGKEWLAAFSARLGCDPPDDETIEILLELAGVAAHASERIAAPLACFLVGRSRVEPTEALNAANQV